MAQPPSDRLGFLCGVVSRELQYLQETDGRLFSQPMTVLRAASLPQQSQLAEQVDAFVARFGRLQDTLGDKLLPALLTWLAEPVGPAIDNLARAERWGWIDSADAWITLRQLRNRMVHEYVNDPAILADALQSAHSGVAVLRSTAQRMLEEVRRRSATALSATTQDNR